MIKSVKKEKKAVVGETTAKVKANRPNKLTKAERKQIKAAKRARAKARSSTKLSVRIVGLVLALIMTLGFVIPGITLVYKTFFGAKSGMEGGRYSKEEMQKLLEEFAKLKEQEAALDGSAESDAAAQGGEQESEENHQETEETATEAQSE